MSSELHRKFRRWAFDTGTTMQSALVGAAEKLCNGSDTPRTPPLSKGIGTYELAKEHRQSKEPGELIMGKCSRCGDTQPVNRLVLDPRTGRKFCPDCVENMKSGQV